MGTLKLDRNAYEELQTTGKVVVSDGSGSTVTIYRSDLTEWELTKLGHGGTVHYREDIKLDARR
jgi:hypothetical protein